MCCHKRSDTGSRDLCLRTILQGEAHQTFPPKNVWKFNLHKNHNPSCSCFCITFLYVFCSFSYLIFFIDNVYVFLISVSRHRLRTSFSKKSVPREVSEAAALANAREELDTARVALLRSEKAAVEDQATAHQVAAGEGGRAKCF